MKEEDTVWMRSMFFLGTDLFIKKNPIARAILWLRGIRDIDAAVDRQTEEYFEYISDVILNES